MFMEKTGDDWEVVYKAGRSCSGSLESTGVAMLQYVEVTFMGRGFEGLD
jgi:hypothetical protein